MIPFENTEIAFAGKSNKDLKRAHRLFKLVASPTLVNMGTKLTDIALAIHFPIKGIVKRTIFKQFCGGESIQECDLTINQLDKYGIGTILDYSVEGKESEKDFENTADEIIRTLEKAEGDPKIPFGVFKMTGIARFELLERCNDITYIISHEEQKEYNHLVARVDKICKKAYESNTPIYIDAEDSWIQDTIDRLATTMMKKYNRERAIVYNTLQMYRHDRLEHLQEAIENAREEKYFYGVKIVRGAYMEKERERAIEKKYPSPIQPDKASTDRDYDAALELIVKNIDICALCAGTHNEDSSQKLVDLMEKYGVDKSNFSIYFAQLLGMSDHISYNLAHNNYHVAKYVPYGPVKEVIPYLLRRAQENTSVAGQTTRELGLILKEMKRRKLK